MSYRVVGWTWSGTIPWIKPAGQPHKGGFKQAAEFITWGVRGGLTKDRLAPAFVPGPRVDTGEAVDVAPSPVGQGHVVRVLLGLDEARPGIRPKGHRCLWASTSFLNVSACSTSSNLRLPMCRHALLEPVDLVARRSVLADRFLTVAMRRTVGRKSGRAWPWLVRLDGRKSP
ncbi:hypothetical protein STHAL_05150 [Streptomyces halstedii]|uniref:Uncharacterized protein n=1 Tax=Streptomyces halstedii TaxID=1944 RepID=A0ABS6TKY0_STRHA|nr:hypothetical protein [Streptomyces halstedii]MBV7668885.1 hypothetical protein [Streptomyces halstedii]